jgi:hypothetical protein
MVTFSNDLTAFIALERVQTKSVAGSRKPRIATASRADDPPPPAAAAAPPPARPAPTGEPSKPGSIRERPDGRPAKHERLNTKLDSSDPW